MTTAKINELVNALDNIEIIDSSFNNIENLSKDQEGLVVLGAGGDPNEWINGISNTLLEEKIASGSRDTMWKNKYYKLTTTGDRTDLVMLFKNGTSIKMNKMATWRIRFGGVSWLSDYTVNYKSQHSGEVI